VSGARPVRLGDYTRLSPAGIVGAGWPRCWITGHRRGDRRDDFVAVMKPLEAAPDSVRLPAAKGEIGPPIRSPQ
jgi:hypothetical protein